MRWWSEWQRERHEYPITTRSSWRAPLDELQMYGLQQANVFNIVNEFLVNDCTKRVKLRSSKCEEIYELWIKWVPHLLILFESSKSSDHIISYGLSLITDKKKKSSWSIGLFCIHLCNRQFAIWYFQQVITWSATITSLSQETQSDLKRSLLQRSSPYAWYRRDWWCILVPSCCCSPPPSSAGPVHEIS